MSHKDKGEKKLMVRTNKAYKNAKNAKIPKPGNNFFYKNFTSTLIRKLPIQASNFNGRFQIRLECFIKKKKIFYSDNYTSLIQNQSLKSEVYVNLKSGIIIKR